MMKTLSQIKPHEKETLDALGGPKRDVFLALVNDDMSMAHTAQMNILALKEQHQTSLIQTEKDRQHTEMMKLLEADHLQLNHTKELLDREQEALEIECRNELEDLFDYQATELRRLEQKLASQIITKSHSPSFLALQKEYNKLIVLKQFDKASVTQALMRNTEQHHISVLEERKMMNDLNKIEQLKNKHTFQIEQLNQRHQTKIKDLTSHQKQEIFRSMQNSRNSTRDMQKAHFNEIYHFKKHCVEADSGIINGTFRGTQKLIQIQNEIKNQ